ncbi:MAG: radical SAM protein [Coriobacteriia bacterium]|nr:radical SAM protein [Coriobacteriia bacterium]
MVFNNVGLVITDCCNARCEMCCSGREDARERAVTLTPDDLNLVLAQVRECADIEMIGVTGGEPMLRTDLVQQICDFDFGRKLTVSLKTNGFWGSDLVKAEEFIARNHAVLTHISFSYDEFHRRYISLDSIKRIIDISQAYSVTTDVVGCFFADSTQPGDILNELGEYAYKTKFVYQPVFRTGLASDFDEERFVRLYEVGKNRLFCPAPRKGSLLITSRLDLYPCCSQVAQNTILRIGNLRDKPLAELLKDMGHNKLLVKLFTEGLDGLLEAAGITKECPGKLSVPCEACELLFADGRYLERIHEALERENQ